VTRGTVRKAGYSCHQDMRLPIVYEDISDAQRPTADAPYFLRNMPLPLEALHF